jgi:hypothetical protein
MDITGCKDRNRLRHGGEVVESTFAGIGDNPIRVHPITAKAILQKGNVATDQKQASVQFGQCLA